MLSVSQTLRTTSGWVPLPCCTVTGGSSPAWGVCQQVHETVHADVDKRGLYDLLRSTRHFAGLVWRLVNQEKIGGLLKDMLTKQL